MSRIPTGLPLELTWYDVQRRAELIARHIKKAGPPPGLEGWTQSFVSLAGVPRGGIYAALAVSTELWKLGLANRIVDNYQEAGVVIDDLIDSGATMEAIRHKYNNPPFYVLLDKRDMEQPRWVVFPWEKAEGQKDEGPEDNVRRILQYIGEDVNRPGLAETPARYVKALMELTRGLRESPDNILKAFDEPGADQIVMLRDIEFRSLCEHHLLPFQGKGHIAYIPNGRVIGVSKLARVLDYWSSRPQIQERICQQVTKTIHDFLEPLGVACILEAQHGCMTCRGVVKQNSVMVTSSLLGVFRDDPAAREELFSLLRG